MFGSLIVFLHCFLSSLLLSVLLCFFTTVLSLTLFIGYQFHTTLSVHHVSCCSLCFCLPYSSFFSCVVSYYIDASSFSWHHSRLMQTPHLSSSLFTFPFPPLHASSLSPDTIRALLACITSIDHLNPTFFTLPASPLLSY